MIAPKVDSYVFGLIIIDGSTYTRDIIILPDRVISDWRRLHGHTLIPEDIRPIFDASPEILVVGTGSLDRLKISDAIIQETKKSGMQLITLPTEKAWQVYNAKKDEKSVAAAFHLTC